LSQETLELLDGVDVLIHDAQYLPSEATLAHDCGHSTTDEALELAVRCHGGTLVMTHDAPGRIDAQLDAVMEEYRTAPIPLVIAKQDTLIDIGPVGARAISN